MKIKEILARMDNPVIHTGNSSAAQVLAAQQSLTKKLVAAVREHLLDLEAAVGCLRSNLRTTRTTLTGLGAIVIGYEEQTTCDLRDVQRLEQL